MDLDDSLLVKKVDNTSNQKAHFEFVCNSIKVTQENQALKKFVAEIQQENLISARLLLPTEAKVSSFFNAGMVLTQINKQWANVPKAQLKAEMNELKKRECSLLMEVETVKSNEDFDGNFKAKKTGN